MCQERSKGQLSQQSGEQNGCMQPRYPAWSCPEESENHHPWLLPKPLRYGQLSGLRSSKFRGKDANPRIMGSLDLDMRSKVQSPRVRADFFHVCVCVCAPQ